MDFNLSNTILVQDFWPLKTEIARFPIRFCLTVIQALCTIQSHGTKSQLLVSKLHSGTFKTKQLVPVHLKFHCTTCSPACVILYHVTALCKGPIGTFKRKFSNVDFVLKILPLKDDEFMWVNCQRCKKQCGVTDFILERTGPEEHLNLSKLHFPSKEGHSGCKFHNIAIRALKGNVLCQIWFKWTY